MFNCSTGEKREQRQGKTVYACIIITSKTWGYSTLQIKCSAQTLQQLNFSSVRFLDFNLKQTQVIVAIRVNDVNIIPEVP